MATKNNNSKTVGRVLNHSLCVCMDTKTGLAICWPPLTPAVAEGMVGDPACTRKYRLGIREIPRAEPVGFPRAQAIFRCMS